MLPQTMFFPPFNPDCPCPPVILSYVGTPTDGQIVVWDETTQTWILSNPNPGDITGVTVTAPITGGGTSGSVNIGIDLERLTLTNPAETHQTLTDGATVNWDMDLGGSAQLTLGGNRTFAAPTNFRQGSTYMLAVIQSAGGNSITWNAVFKWPGGTAPTLSSGAGDVDIIAFYSYDGVNLYGVANNDFS